MMLRLSFILICSLFAGSSPGQYKWELSKTGNGINVYKSDVPNSAFKAIKVECTLTGTYTKLISILTNVSQFGTWIYNLKTSKPIKKNTENDLVYYAETHLPWPLSNRDAVIHLQINTESLPQSLTITGSSEPGLVEKVDGKVRIGHYAANWRVTMPTANTIQIYYTLEVDPGGSVPGWVVNSFAEKGPYETFSNLAKKLKE